MECKVQITQIVPLHISIELSQEIANPFVFILTEQSGQYKVRGETIKPGSGIDLEFETDGKYPNVLHLFFLYVLLLKLMGWTM